MKTKKTELRTGVGKKIPISPALFIAVAGFLLALVLEMLSRRSLAGAFVFLAGKPHIFLFNALIVCASLALAMLFRKKVFTVTLVSALWLGFGVANCVLLGFRTASPLTAVDLQLGMEAILMIDAYFEIWQIIAIFAGGLGAIALLVYLALRSPRYRKEGQKGLLRACAYAIALLVCALVLFTRPGLISTNLRPSLYDAYLDYGFPYCFCYSFFDVGIKQPEGYSGEEVKLISEEIDIDIEVKEEEKTDSLSLIDSFIESVRSGAFENEPEGYTAEAVETIRDMLVKPEKQETGVTPNIIFLQMESFFDPLTLKGVTFSQDPVPNFRALCEKYTTGRLYVPTVAGGTVNTEFEVLTGCSLDFFGAGEFPYYSILRERACESLATDLRVLGYTATGVHNYTGSFYYRNDVYQNLGFNRFVPREYMEGYALTPTGWAKDAILGDVIREALASTEDRDFIYTISMQTHGKYIEQPAAIPSAITVTGLANEHERLVMEYFINQLYEVDAFIGDLLQSLEESEEETMVVIFGDHLPGLNLTEDMLEGGDIYATRYAIWSNFDLPKSDRDLQAYQLGAYALKQAGLDIGVMVKFHQTQMDTEGYMRNFEILEYDMLYGDRHIYGGKELQVKGQIQMGLQPVEILGARVKNGHLFVLGRNFTSASRIYVDEAANDTIFIDETLLVAANLAPEDGKVLTVLQLSDEGAVLSQSAPYACAGLAPVDYGV